MWRRRPRVSRNSQHVIHTRTRQFRELRLKTNPLLITQASHADVLTRTEKGQKNSPSRWRFRPPPPRTFGFRLRPSGMVSAYSRSALGAALTLATDVSTDKEPPTRSAAFCGGSFAAPPSGPTRSAALGSAPAEATIRPPDRAQILPADDAFRPRGCDPMSAKGEPDDTATARDPHRRAPAGPGGRPSLDRRPERPARRDQRRAVECDR